MITKNYYSRSGNSVREIVHVGRLTMISGLAVPVRRLLLCSRLTVNCRQMSVKVAESARQETTSNNPEVVDERPHLIQVPEGVKVEKSLFRKWFSIQKWWNITEIRNTMCGYDLYEKATDDVDFESFFDKLSMPDTFFSWFLVTELHVWLISVRLMAEGDKGKSIRNHLFSLLWEDVEKRSKLLDNVVKKYVRKEFHELMKHFRPALTGYDEGLLAGDVVLAGALWRRFFQKNCLDAEQMELMIKYIRLQTLALDQLSRRDFLVKKNVNWLSIKDI